MEIEDSDPFRPAPMFDASEKAQEIRKIEDLYKILRPLLYIHRDEAEKQLKSYWGAKIHFSTSIANAKKTFQNHLPNIYKDMIAIIRQKAHLQVYIQLYRIILIVNLFREMVTVLKVI